jgi:hypothetical protein
MAKTGTVVLIEPNAMAADHSRLRQGSRRQRLLCGLSAIAFVASVALPITIDVKSMAPGFNAALAAGPGNGNGNGDGQGKGKGNGKGKGDENGNGKPPKGGGDDDDDDDDDDGPGDTDDGDTGSGGADDDDHGGRIADRNLDPDDHDGGGNSEIDEAVYADAVTAVGSVPANNPAGLPASPLPTVKQIFALGEGSVLNPDQELLAIQNGWNAQN